jgi:hypothetical protein
MLEYRTALGLRAKVSRASGWAVGSPDGKKTLAK